MSRSLITSLHKGFVTLHQVINFNPFGSLSLNPASRGPHEAAKKTSSAMLAVVAWAGPLRAPTIPGRTAPT